MIDGAALWLSLQLALTSSLLLLLMATPLAWWLSRTRHRLAPLVEATVALPLVLPPTVLGFYLLLLFSPQSFIGQAWVTLTGSQLTFSFAGLVIASVMYSLPFAVQPLQVAFSAVDRAYLEAAATLGASPWDRFVSVVLPLSKRGYLTAGVLAFAHTLGEFGVVLMIGGNIPGETRVVSIAIYEAVETLDYPSAHGLSLILLAFSLLVLWALFGGRRRAEVREVMP